MSEKDQNNHEELPQDDRGIQNDKIIDIADYIVSKTYDTITSRSPKELPSIQDLESMARTIYMVHSLVRDVLDIEAAFREWEMMSDDDDLDIEDDLDDLFGDQ